MSRGKEVFEEYHIKKTSSTSPRQKQRIKYIPMDYQLEQMYPYDISLDNPSRRIRSQCHTDLKPRHYYVPVAPNNDRTQETFYKHSAMNNQYMYYKICPKYFPHDQLQNSSNPNSVVYLKYSRPFSPENNSYYEPVDHELGDFNRDYYEYDDQNIKYYETERKYDYNRSFSRNNEYYYENDYAPKTRVQKQSSKTVKNYMKYMETNITESEKKTNITESEKKTKYFNDKKPKDTNKVLPQKINSSIERSKSYLEPVKYDSKPCRKMENTKSETVEISTLYEKESKSQPKQPKIPKTTPKKTYTAACCQTFISGDVTPESPKLLKESSSKCTQTLQLDFTENNHLCTTGTQTLFCQSSEIFTEKKQDIKKMIENAKTFFTESVIRWMKQITLYFLWNMYNCPNPEQIVFFAQKPLNKIPKTKPSPLSSPHPPPEIVVQNVRRRRIHRK